MRNTEATNYVQLVEFGNLGAKMSIKIHYLFSHLNRFPENLGELSKEQNERFHQDIKVVRLWKKGINEYGAPSR